MNMTEKFDIVRASNNQNKPDTVTFYSDIDRMTEQMNVSLQITTNADDGIPFQLFIDTYSIDTQMGALCGGTILILLNVLIISEVKMNFRMSSFKCILNQELNRYLGDSSYIGGIIGSFCINWHFGRISR